MPSPRSRWLYDVFRPEVGTGPRGRRWIGDPTQAYCDLLEVRWLLSEEAGTDVGDDPALEAPRPPRPRPTESAANLAFVDVATRELPALGLDPRRRLPPVVLMGDNVPPSPRHRVPSRMATVTLD